MVGLLTLVVAPISGVVPNTPIVASLLPVLETWCHKRGIAPSRVLLPSLSPRCWEEPHTAGQFRELASQ